MKLTNISKKQLFKALEESIKLQSHYAELLNMWDGGKRYTFQSAEEWIQRLNELDKESS